MYVKNDTVRAFHPHEFGVVRVGRIVEVGRKWVYVDFGPIRGGTWRVAPDHVVEVVETGSYADSH